MTAPAEWNDTLLSVVVDAGSVIMAAYKGGFEVEYKGARDPVTVADRRANELILARLGQLAPDVPVVAEESDPRLYADFERSDQVFFVDPLDGTRDFVARNGEFVVMIGLLCEHRVTLGVIHSPVQRVSWVGHVGHGAFRVGPDGTWTSLHVSSVDEVSRATIVVSRSRQGQPLMRALGRLDVATVRALGSAGLKGVSVAEGSADAYLAVGAAGQRWDVCALDALVRAAGGRVTDVEGHDLDYRSESLLNDRGLLVTNGRMHRAIVDRLASAVGADEYHD